MVKKYSVLAVLFAAFVCIAPFARANDIEDNFAANLNDTSLDALAKDLGTILAGGSFHQGKALGFPIGVDVGVHVPVTGVDDEDVILKDNTSTIGAVWGQVEVGLPLKFNVIGRVGKIEEANLLGGGIRYGILSPSVPGLPSWSIDALYNQAEHDFFDMKTYTVQTAVSIDFPIIHPYIGAGYDSSELKPTAKAFSLVSPVVSRSTKGKATGYRVEGGVNLSIIPFTYITLGAGVANGQELYHAGLGVKF